MLFAAMRVSPIFAGEVCRLCGFHLRADQMYTVQREVAIDLGRPDLFIDSADGRRLIIEVKLDDRNYHFDQYNDQSPYCRGATIALVTNHALDAPSRQAAATQSWRVLTWSDLLDAADSRSYGEKAEAIAAFCAYARKVCRRERPPQMRFDWQTFGSFRVLASSLRRIVE